MISFQREIVSALDDFNQGVKNRHIWSELGLNDVRNRYSRSKLGAIWAGLSILIFVCALGPVYATLMGVELRVYMIHLLLGFIVWNFASSVILESGSEFINSANYLISFQLSYSTLLLRVVWRNLIVVGYQMLVFVLIALLLRQPLGISWLILPVSIVLVSLNMLWLGLLVGVFATRFRDLAEVVNNVLRLAFFVTPIIWIPDLNSSLASVANLNPFYHLIELVRAPLLLNSLPLNSWLIFLGLLCGGWVIALLVFAKCRSRIAFWI